MNQKKRTQEKSKFSKLRLHSSSKKLKNSCSPRPEEKISSYFASVLNDSEINLNIENTSEDTSNTMITRLRNKIYVQKVGTKISSELNTDSDTSDDIGDFRKPKISKEVKKSENKLSNKETLVKNIKTRTTQSSRNSYLNHIKNDTNPEHLQLAIAMSKSISDAENPQDAESMENMYPSTQQKIMRAKQTLDQFGFKSAKCPTQTNSKTNVKLMKGKKFKYITPTLFLRTEADRSKLVENKVSQIINNISIYNATQEKNKTTSNNDNNKPRSFILRDYYKEIPVLFSKNALCVSDTLQENILFYNGIIQPSNVEVGVLLKNWLTIPGREATPPLEENIPPGISQDESVNVLQVSSTEISMSPELFTDSDVDDKTEHNEKNNTSREAFLNSTNSITQIDKENIIESYSSTKSVSLLDNIKANYNKKTSIINMSVAETESIDSSLSPFPDTSKFLNTSTIKQIKSKHDLENGINENSDSLSPFESVNLEINKSPQRKVTPKKMHSSPKKYVVTPKGRKIISPNNSKKNSSCKRSILFTGKQDGETIHSATNTNNEICHFESFCNDNIECFDLTHSSDDEVIDVEKINKNDNEPDKSFTITQLLDKLSSERSVLHKEDINKDQMSHDSQASIETIKLNIAKSIDTDVDEDYSPEFDCLNLSNNKVFYETLNNSLSSNKNYNSIIFSEKSINNITKNQIDFLNLDAIEGKNCGIKIHDNIETNATPISIKNTKENALKTTLINDEIECSFSSPNIKTSSKLRRSYSENFLNDKKIPNESTPRSKYFGLSAKDRKLSRSFNEIEKNDLNFPINESNDNLVLSQSSISTCSDISDEELNYSCYSIYKRYNLSNRIISISDEENDSITSSSDNENISQSNENLNDSLNIAHNSAIQDNLRTLHHPRVSKLCTPLNMMKTKHPLNHFCHSEENSLIGENTIQEIIASNNTATPKTDIIINDDSITPKGHYSDMDTPERNRELEKYGLKPMKRNKGVKILHYIYDSTHPYVTESNDEKILNDSSDDENGKATKRRKTKSHEEYNEERSSIDFIRNDGNFFLESVRENVNQIAESENIEDMIFERKISNKISSCRLPLHVAWNNLLISSKELQETILTYIPIQVEDVYKQFKILGYKFHMQDIIAFLDKKCITIRIAQNNRHQKKVNSIK